MPAWGLDRARHHDVVKRRHAEQFAERRWSPGGRYRDLDLHGSACSTVAPHRAEPLQQVEHFMVFGQHQRGERPDPFRAHAR